MCVCVCVCVSLQCTTEGGIVASDMPLTRFLYTQADFHPCLFVTLLCVGRGGGDAMLT